MDSRGAGHAQPDREGSVLGGTVSGGSQAVTAGLEVGLDAVVEEQAALRVADLNRSICRSRRRVGWCDTSTRLFRYLLCQCSTRGGTYR